MIKPIETWTKTFAKLGRRVHRIWRTGQQPSGEYRFSGFEQLEERQMLSGTGGDDLGDPSGTGDTTPGSSSDNGALVDNADHWNSPTISNALGYSSSNSTSLSSIWSEKISGNYSWNHANNLASYETIHSVGTTGGTFYTTDYVSLDEDLGTFIVSFSQFDYSITISQSDRGNSVGMPGPTTGEGDWYREVLRVDLSGFKIITTDLSVIDDYIDNGFFDSFDTTTFNQAGVQNGFADFDFKADVGEADTLDDFTVTLTEHHYSDLNFTTDLDTFFKRKLGDSATVEIDGTVQVSTDKTVDKHGYLEWNFATDSQYTTNGTFQSEANSSLTFSDARISESTVGYSPATLETKTEPENIDTSSELGIDGTSTVLEVNGTLTRGSLANSSFSGTVDLYLADTQLIHSGTVHSAVISNSSFDNNLQSKLEQHERITGAARVYTTDGYSMIVKGAGQELDVVNRYSKLESNDLSDGTSSTFLSGKTTYQPGGLVVYETGDFLGLQSFETTTVNYDITSGYASIQDIHSFDENSNENEFSKSSGTYTNKGTATTTTTFDTKLVELQPGVSASLPPQDFTGTISVDGTDQGTITNSSTSTSGTKRTANYTATFDNTVELEMGDDGTVSADTGTAEGTYTNLFAVTISDSSTVKVNDSLDNKSEYLDTGEIRVTDKDTFTRTTTQLDSSLTTKIDNEYEAAGSAGSESGNFNDITTITTTGASSESLNDQQAFWGTAEGLAATAGMLGSARVIKNDLVYVFTPVEDEESEGDATSDTGDGQLEEPTATASSGTGESEADLQLYEITKTGTVEVKTISNVTDTTTSKGDSDDAGTKFDDNAEFESDEILKLKTDETWDKTYNGGSGFSLTEMYTYSADGTITLHKTGTASSSDAGGGLQTGSLATGQSIGQLDSNSSLNALTADPDADSADTWNQSFYTVENMGRYDLNGNLKVGRTLDAFTGNETTSSENSVIYDVTYTFTPTTFEVPTSSLPDSDGAVDPDAGSDDTSQTLTSDSDGDQTENATDTITVDGYELSTVGSITTKRQYSERFDYDSGISFAGFLQQKTSPGHYNETVDRSMGATTRILEANGNYDSFELGVIETYVFDADGKLTITTNGLVDDGEAENAVVKSSSGTKATDRSKVIGNLWQDSLETGQGRNATSSITSDPQNGPNVDGSASYKLKLIDWQVVIDPSLFPEPTGDEESSDSGSDYDVPDYTSGSGYSSDGSSSDGSGESSQDDSTSEPNYEALLESAKQSFQNWDAYDLGYDLTGRMEESSSSNFTKNESWTTGFNQELKENQGLKTGTDADDGEGNDERSVGSSSAFVINFQQGANFVIEALNRTLTSTHSWNDYDVNDTSQATTYEEGENGPEQVSHSSRSTHYETDGEVSREDKFEMLGHYYFDSDNPDRPIDFAHSITDTADATAEVTVEGTSINQESELSHKTIMSETDTGTAVQYRSSTWQVDDENPYGHSVYSHLIDPDQENPTIQQSVNVQRPVEDNWYKPAGQDASPTVSDDQASSSETNPVGKLEALHAPTGNFVWSNTLNNGYVPITQSDTNGSGTADNADTVEASSTDDKYSETLIGKLLRAKAALDAFKPISQFYQPGFDMIDESAWADGYEEMTNNGYSLPAAWIVGSLGESHSKLFAGEHKDVGLLSALYATFGSKLGDFTGVSNIANGFAQEDYLTLRKMGVWESRGVIFLGSGQLLLTAFGIKGMIPKNAVAAGIARNPLLPKNLRLGLAGDYILANGIRAKAAAGVGMVAAPAARVRNVFGSNAPAKNFVRFGGALQRQALLNSVRASGTLREAKGVVHSFREMKRLGYELQDVSLHYRGNQGVDLIFYKGRQYAVVEAKHGKYLSLLKTYKGNLRQGSLPYNTSRLQRYLQYGDGTHNALAQQLLRDARTGQLESFATFYRSGRILELPIGWPKVKAIQR